LRRYVPTSAVAAMALSLLTTPVAVEAQAPLLSANYSLEDVLDPIPKTSSVTFQPTYEQLTNGAYNAYVKFKPVLVVESGVPLVSRIEWPIPEMDNENGQTNAGVGDLKDFELRLSVGYHFPALFPK